MTQSLPVRSHAALNLIKIYKKEISKQREGPADNQVKSVELAIA